MPDCIGIRYDEELLGRIMVAKYKATDGLTMETTHIPVKSTVLPDVTFNSFAEWKDYVHEQSALNERLKIETKQRQEDFQDNIDYYRNFITNKFNQIS